jgi:hypothetical protein
MEFPEAPECGNSGRDEYRSSTWNTPVRIASSPSAWIDKSGTIHPVTPSICHAFSEGVRESFRFIQDLAGSPFIGQVKPLEFAVGIDQGGHQRMSDLAGFLPVNKPKVAGNCPYLIR